MEMQGEARLEASRELVWEALNDANVLQASIPGCESLERTADNEFTATVVSKVGPIKARFGGKVTLSNIEAPRGYTLTGEGSGGAAGFAKADIEVSLDALEQEVTLLRYGVKANVGGKLAQLGSRMIDAAARKSADDFFDLFGKQVQSRASNGTATRSTAKGGFDISQVIAPAINGASTVVQTAKEGPLTEVAVARPPTEGKAPAPVQASAAQPTLSDHHAAVTDVLMTEKIKVWISDQIAVVTLNRPSSRNAMTYGMWLAIPSVLAALERNPEVRAVLLTGAGQDFCAGADIPEFEKVRADVSQATAYEVAVDACCDAIMRLSKPTIAVLRGYCLGGGAHLAMSCDFRFAAPGAVFGIPAARLSIIYGVKGTRKLLSLVGITQAKKILFSAERFKAEEALHIGFVDRVAGRVDAPTKPSWFARIVGSKPRVVQGDPMTEARVFAASLASNAPLSISGAKYLLNGMVTGAGALDLSQAEALIAQAAGSDDYREGRSAFAEKRAPKFQGR